MSLNLLKKIGFGTVTIILVFIFFTKKENISSLFNTLEKNKVEQLKSSEALKNLSLLKSNLSIINDKSVNKLDNLVLISSSLSDLKHSEIDSEVMKYISNSIQSNDPEVSGYINQMGVDFIRIFASQNIEPIGNTWREFFAKEISLNKEKIITDKKVSEYLRNNNLI